MPHMVDEDQAKEFTSWNHVHIKTHKSNLHITIDWNVVFQMTSTKVDFAVKTRPCLISEARNFLKPSSSSTAVNPNGSKNPSGSLAPICWEGWNDACAAKTTVLAHVKDLWKQINVPNVTKNLH